MGEGIEITFDEKPEERKVLIPHSVTKVDLAEAGKEIEVPDGQALVFAVDNEGNPIHGKWWFYPLRNVDRVYGDTSKFFIKKKVKQ